MIKNYFLIAVRNIRRKKVFSLLNIFGLALGFSTALFIGIYIWQEINYDKFHIKSGRIAWLTTSYHFNGETGKISTTGTKAGPALMRNFPEIENFTRLIKSTAIFRYKNQAFEEDNIVYADSSFFNIFSFNLIAGDPSTALNQPNQVVITAKSAEKYFGKDDPVGKTLTVNDQKEYLVTGLVENVPDNSQIRFDFLVSFSTLNASKEENWLPANYFTFLLLKDKSSMVSLQPKIRPFMDQRIEETELGAGSYMTFDLMPIRKIHLYSDFSPVQSGISPLAATSDIKYIYIFGSVALLVLLIACINYINLATARTTERSTEVGVRKVLGAIKNQLFLQFMAESIALCFTAAVLSFIIVYFGFPYFETVTGKNIELIDILPQILVGSFLMFLIVSLIAGSYPAIVLSKLIPAKTLKGNYRHSSSGLWLRKTLITFQFFISIGLIVCTIIIYYQLNFLQKSNLGYQKEHVLVINLRNQVEEKFEVLKNNLKQNSRIEEVTMVYETPTKIDWGGSIKTSVMDEGISANCIPVEKDYIKTLNIQLIAGRDFNDADQEKSTQDYQNDSDFSMIINETAAKIMGWDSKEAIGQRLERPLPGNIVGVVKDYHYAPMQEKIGPLVMMCLDMYHQMLIKIDGQELAGTLKSVEKEWKKIAPNLPFTYHFMDEEFNTIYASEQRISKLFNIFTALAIGLGLLGLLGLSAYTINQRTKEISIRKILGASITQIITLLSKDFLRIVFIAFILATPFAWYVMNQWLMNYEYRIDINILIFIGSGAAVLILTLIILSIHSYRTAKRNPIETIRYE